MCQHIVHRSRSVKSRGVDLLKKIQGRCFQPQPAVDDRVPARAALLARPLLFRATRRPQTTLLGHGVYFWFRRSPGLLLARLLGVSNRLLSLPNPRGGGRRSWRSWLTKPQGRDGLSWRVAERPRSCPCPTREEGDRLLSLPNS